MVFGHLLLAGLSEKLICLTIKVGPSQMFQLLRVDVGFKVGTATHHFIQVRLLPVDNFTFRIGGKDLTSSENLDHGSIQLLS